MGTYCQFPQHTKTKVNLLKLKKKTINQTEIAHRKKKAPTKKIGQMADFVIRLSFLTLNNITINFHQFNN